MKRMFLLLALASIVGVGCKSSAAQSMEQLQESIEGYNHAYRWKNYERAASFLPPDLRPAFIAAYEDDESSLHIENYRILAVDVESDNAAEVRVRMSYTLLPDITVKKRTLTQYWQRIAGAWIMENEDDSLRTIDVTKKPKNPAAKFGEAAEVDPNTAVEVTNPEGEVIRQDGPVDAPEEPQEAPEGD